MFTITITVALLMWLCGCGEAACNSACQQSGSTTICGTTATGSGMTVGHSSDRCFYYGSLPGSVTITNPTSANAEFVVAGTNIVDDFWTVIGTVPVGNTNFECTDWSDATNGVTQCSGQNTCSKSMTLASVPVGRKPAIKIWCRNNLAQGTCQFNSGSSLSVCWTVAQATAAPTSAPTTAAPTPAPTTAAPPPTTTPTTNNNNNNPSGQCFHETTPIKLHPDGPTMLLRDFEAGSVAECVIPHVVVARGVHITTGCGGATLRTTDGHLIYTLDGLKPASNIRVHKDHLINDKGDYCQVLSIAKDVEDQRFFGLNCINSTVYAHNYKTSTFETLHTIPAMWMHLVGRLIGIKRASAIGDQFSALAHRLGVM